MAYQEDFITNNLQSALAVEEKYGVPHIAVLAQAALESEWGKKTPGNNHFGIRANKAWTGPTVKITTHEDVDGKLVKQTNQPFRAYGTTKDSFMDYGKFLTSNQRYKGAFSNKDPFEFLKAVALAGYATDRRYVSKMADMVFSVKKRLPKDYKLVKGISGSQNQMNVDDGIKPSEVGGTIATGMAVAGIAAKAVGSIVKAVSDNKEGSTATKPLNSEENIESILKKVGINPYAAPTISISAKDVESHIKSALRFIQ